MKLAFPTLFVKDIERSKDFYTGVMGFRITMDSGVYAIFDGSVSIWQRDSIRDVVGLSDIPEEGARCELCFESRDIEMDYENFKKSGTVIVNELAEQPWRQLVFRALDPDGHLIEVGEPLNFTVRRLFISGMSDEEISESTTIPVDTVRVMKEQD
ncbi:VOC family protein [Limisalsivibrio acetivorans]|uniref:VOC family protein n=1 Tax=Limisalsivibrio acetivorans TaxID=1304888 RepID=UPI0003B372B7|nr:VOC family protein [Limisalsivibrio acetivorans]